MAKATVTGAWTNQQVITAHPPNPQGYGTDRLTWGKPPASGAPNALRFTGGTVDIPLDGSEFVLGTLTHENRPTSSSGISESRLTVKAVYDDSSQFAAELIVRHQETPDLEGPVDDLVSIPGVFYTLSKAVNFDGVPYIPVITRILPPPEATGELPDPLVGDLAMEAGMATAEGEDTAGAVVAVMVRTDRPDVRITTVRNKGEVARTQSDEYIELINTGAPSISLKGWQISAGDKGQDFTFPDFTLVGGHTIRVYTNEIHPQWGGFSFASNRAIWNDKGDTGELRKPDGTVVSSYAYGDASTS